MSTDAQPQIVRMVRSAVALLVVPILLTGCGSNENDAPIMPDVVGSKLDVAKSDIERAGYTDSVEVLGGGMFGVVNESNWVVCDQLPDGGERIAEEPRLEVDRSCGGSETATTATEEETTTESASTEEPATTEDTMEEPTTEIPTPESKPTHELAGPTTVARGGADAATIEQKFIEHLGNNFVESISSMCDPGYTHWACFYDGVEGGSDSYLQVNLTTDGGWSDSGLDDMAKQAGIHWFNFIGCDFQELDTIVVNINGLDHNIFRHDVPMMNLGCN